MFNSYRIKTWLSLPLLRAHLCTLAVALSFNSTWRVPRDAFRYGGLPYGLILTVVMTIVALPVVLLQLSIGQLSQQDAVGVWRAVPFFRGVGYLRMLVSLLGSVYTSIYVSLSATYFLYTLSNSIPFWDCMEFINEEGEIEPSLNASVCLDNTFMSSVNQSPEYYLAVALIVIVLWIAFPFMFYSSVKLIRRTYYVLGPVVLLLCIIVSSAVGESSNLSSFVVRSDWGNLLRPDIWLAALVQALLSTQIASGYLISAGDSIYSSTNVQWTAIAFVGANIVSTWVSLLFWFGVTVPGPMNRDTGMLAVLVQTYHTAETKELDIVWPLLIFAMLFLSGVITMLALLLPIYDRTRRMGGVKWRIVSFTGSILGAGVAQATLAGRIPALTLLEDTAVPFVTIVATVIEILVFVFIYGWKVLVEDVEFLIGTELCKYWVWGWCAAPGVIAPFFIWWTASIFIRDTEWTEPPWTASTTAAAAAATLVILLICASVAVWRQVQYDLIGKLKSSFEPSRHWGPRDPITHYYWLATRDGVDRGIVPRSRYHRRQLGQLSSRPSILHVTNESISVEMQDIKTRSNSDDWVYTVNRKKYLSQVLGVNANERKRSRSLDWALGSVFRRNSDIISISKKPVDYKENNNNVEKYVTHNNSK